MTRRSDTPFSNAWVARLGAPAILGALTALAGANPLAAQILGEQTPGTPGAIQGEFRTRPMPLAADAPAAALRGADPEVDAQERARRFGLQRRPNTAIRRSLGSGQHTRTGYAGAAPSGLSGPTSLAPDPRSPESLSGTRFDNAGRRAVAGAPPARPALAQQAAPGLGAPPRTQPKRTPPEDDPYAPLGIRAGTMILRPSIEASAGYDTNPARSPATTHKSSAFVRTEGALAATSDWSAHQLDINLRGAYTGFTGLTTANRPEGDARIALRLDVTRDLALDAAITAKLDTESATSVNLPGGATGRTPMYSYGTALGATQRFGYASVSLKGSVDRFTYADVTTGGGVVSQQARNYNSYGLRLRSGYEVTPGVTPFVEAGIDRRVHDLTLDAGGYARDSSGATLRLGSTFELARTLTGEVSAGYTIRAYEDARLQSMKAPVVAAALNWSVSPLTTLGLKAESDIAETTIAGSSGARTYRTTASLTHAFLRNFTATASLALTRSDYDRITRVENTLTGGLKLEYRFNRLMALRASYTFERQNVNTPGENYKAHAVMLGMKYTP